MIVVDKIRDTFNGKKMFNLKIINIQTFTYKQIVDLISFSLLAHYSHFCKLSFFKDASERHLNNFIICHLWLSILFIFGQGFHYVLFLEYISVDADDQDSEF